MHRFLYGCSNWDLKQDPWADLVYKWADICSIICRLYLSMKLVNTRYPNRWKFVGSTTRWWTAPLNSDEYFIFVYLICSQIAASHATTWVIFSSRQAYWNNAKLSNWVRRKLPTCLIENTKRFANEQIGRYAYGRNTVSVSESIGKKL